MFLFYFTGFLCTAHPHLGLLLVAITLPFLYCRLTIVMWFSHIHLYSRAACLSVSATKGDSHISQALLSWYVSNKLFLLQTSCGFACKCKSSRVSVSILQHFNSESELRSQASLSRVYGLKRWCFCIRFLKMLSRDPGVTASVCQILKT